LSINRVFSDWLAKQSARDDEIGEFARVVAADPYAPRKAYRPQAWILWAKLNTTASDPSALVNRAFDEFAGMPT
jgi:hypothetical protein